MSVPRFVHYSGNSRVTKILNRIEPWQIIGESEKQENDRHSCEAQHVHYLRRFNEIPQIAPTQSPETEKPHDRSAFNKQPRSIGFRVGLGEPKKGINWRA